MSEPMTLRKLLARFSPEELEKYMDCPMMVRVCDPNLNVETAEIYNDWPHRAEPRPSENYPGEFRFTVHLDRNLRKRKAA